MPLFQDGKEHGDEYLAELDYIENVEKVKEGYEEEVVISSDDEDEPRKAGARAGVDTSESDDGASQEDDETGDER